MDIEVLQTLGETQGSPKRIFKLIAQLPTPTALTTARAPEETWFLFFRQTRREVISRYFFFVGFASEVLLLSQVFELSIIKQPKNLTNLVKCGVTPNRVAV